MNDNKPKSVTPSAANQTNTDYATRNGSVPFSGMPIDLNDTGPARIGDYTILRILGEGGMGTVYLAEDARLGRQVAIKTMKPELATPEDRARFLREARAIAAVEHDNIVIILQVGEATDGSPFIVMPFLQGEMLEARLKREPITHPGILLKVALDVAEGLTAAHAKGLIHRDIKPANVWLEGDPTAPKLSQQIRRCKILDFGLARSMSVTDMQITSTGMLLGTPAYMAPEQARGEKVDHRADLFSLGVMLYRMTTGRQPFAGPTVMAVLTALASVNPPPARTLNPNVPLALSDLIKKLMKKDSAERMQSAAEVTATIRQIAKEQQGKKSAPPSSGLPTATYVPPVVPPVPGKVAKTLIEAPPADNHHHVPPRRKKRETETLLEALPDGEAQAKTHRRTMTRRAALTLAVTAPLGIGVCAGGLWWMNSEKKDRTEPPNPLLISSEPKPGEERSVEIADGVKMVFCWIPAGTAQLGSPRAERDEVLKQLKAKEEPEWLTSEAEGKRGKYTTKGFWLGKYPVTQEEWQAVIKANPSSFDGKTVYKDNKAKGLVTTRFPVEQVSWYDSYTFLEKLNDRNVASKALGMKGKLVLPHEDEWEYAYRGGKGNKTAFYWGDKLNGKEANSAGTKPYGTKDEGPFLERTTEVGRYEKVAPHPWGLCDMSGNVLQWCDNLYTSEKTNRVVRGGSWGYDCGRCRGARRYEGGPGNCVSCLGVRLSFRLD